MRSGSLCIDRNECGLDLDDCHPNATCTNITGGFSCRCTTGFQGDGRTCTATPCNAGFETGPNNTCVDSNECTLDTDDCDPNANCNNTIRG